MSNISEIADMVIAGKFGNMPERKASIEAIGYDYEEVRKAVNAKLSAKATSAPNINRCYMWAIQTCNNPKVGYSQRYRNAQKANGITYYDCSSFINYALIKGGFSTPAYAPLNNAFTTSTEESVLLSLGFHQVPATGEIRPGDVGLNAGHTEMCYKAGTGRAIFMGAHTSNAALVNQVSIGNSSGNASAKRSFKKLFRYKDGATVEGASIFVVSAMCGNFWQESGINPGVWEGLAEGTWTDLGKGYGLGQWTNTGGDTHGRLYQLHEYLSDNGLENDDLYGQLDFLVEEGVWYSAGSAADFATLDEFINSDSTDIAYLTHAFNRGWEGIHDDTWDARVDYANRCYDFIMENYDNEDITEYYTGNVYLSESQRLNNAVMIYRYLGTGFEPEKVKKGMPVYMMVKRR